MGLKITSKKELEQKFESTEYQEFITILLSYLVKDNEDEAYDILEDETYMPSEEIEDFIEYIIKRKDNL